MNKSKSVMNKIHTFSFEIEEFVPSEVTLGLFTYLAFSYRSVAKKCSK